jgi:signal transduction histidine kinase
MEQTFVHRPTVLIISDNTDFPHAIASHWHGQRNSPAFTLHESDFCGQPQVDTFDLAIIGGLAADVLGRVLEALKVSGKPVIHISRLNGDSPAAPGLVTLPEVPGWPELLVTVASQILERQRATADLERLAEAHAELECHASLGRYMLEARHNLNNALTSVLGNSELILLEPEALATNLRAQIETIRNMGMRMNEIMQRFSSLQKEMQLVEKQAWKKTAKAAAGA